MNTTETAVTNAVNLSFFMVNLSYRLLPLSIPESTLIEWQWLAK